MKICMFTNTYLPHVGGVARSVSFFTEDLRAMGHDVLVVAPTFPNEGDEEEKSAEISNDEDMVLRVPALQNFNGSDFSVRIPLPFIIDEKIDEFAPDLIHSHHPFLLGDAAMRAAKYRDLPLVFTHHTLYEKYTHYVSSKSDAMKRFAINLSTEYANMCCRVIAPSESVARMLRKRGVETPVEELPTGVDIRFFANGSGDNFRQELSIPQDAFLVGHLGRLAFEKNLDYLTQAVVEFLKNHPNAGFLVVGSGPSEEDILEIFEENGVSDRLFMAGKLTGQALSDAYHAMDLFVFSSRSETQGMVLVEAMAAGKPVIALDASGAREVVEDGENGRLLPAETPAEEFAETIKEAAEDPDLLKKWADKAFETSRHFSREVCATRLLGIYVETIKEHDASKGKEDLDIWDDLLRSIKVEWELLSEKAAAVAGIMKSDDAQEVELD